MPSPATHAKAPATHGLFDAQDRHDAWILRHRNGVTTRALAHDQALWEDAALAIVALACRLHEVCAASAFCDARPAPQLLAVRISEALDDEIDAHAWAVIDAATRVHACGQA